MHIGPNQPLKRTHIKQRAAVEIYFSVQHGETIEDYPDDIPYPSRLILGWYEQQPLHVVAAYNRDDNETIVITVYQPDLALWSADFRRRLT